MNQSQTSVKEDLYDNEYDSSDSEGSYSDADEEEDMRVGDDESNSYGSSSEQDEVLRRPSRRTTTSRRHRLADGENDDIMIDISEKDDDQEESSGDSDSQLKLNQLQTKRDGLPLSGEERNRLQKLRPNRFDQAGKEE